MNSEQYLQFLRNQVEQRIDFAMRTPKDFEALSDSIMEKIHLRVSSSTLKRLWGYIQTDTSPRLTTLNILAKYLDYADYQAFCQAHAGGKDITDPDDETIVSPSDTPQPTIHPTEREDCPEHRSPSPRKLLWPWFVLLLALTAGAAYFWGLSQHWSDRAGQPPYFLHKGQTFATEQDYLKLFGIHAKDHLWGQQLPHHPDISVWGPQYHHPSWHNDGDSAQLLPTINEWWEPTDSSADSVFIATRNSDRYLTYQRMNEQRITFMRGLTPDGDSLTFLGVYRLDLSHSDVNHLIWERVAEQVDLNHLDYLEELRN